MGGQSKQLASMSPHVVQGKNEQADVQRISAYIFSVYKDASGHAGVVSRRRTKCLFESSSIAGKSSSAVQRERIGDLVLELLRTSLTGVLGENTRLRRRTDAFHFFIREIGEVMQDVAVVGRQKNLATGLKERIEPRPVIRNHRRSASRRL